MATTNDRREEKRPLPAEERRKPPVERQRHDTPMSSHILEQHSSSNEEKAASQRMPASTRADLQQRRGSTEHVTALLPIGREQTQSPRIRQIHELEFARSTQTSTPVRFANLPSLRAGQSISRTGTPKRSASRRGPEEHLREEQIRAMSASPISMGRYNGSSGDGFHRQAKRSRDDPRKDLRSSHSNVSLQGAESILSSYTVPADRRRWDLGLVDALSPRPTIRHSFQQPISSTALGPNLLLASTIALGSRPGTRDDIDDGETIAQLADNLDSGTIRQLMERDQRRKDRRRMLEEDKARRRLERHAAKRAGESSPLTRRRTRSRSKLNTKAEDASVIGLAVSDEAGPSDPFRYQNAVRSGRVPRAVQAVEPPSNPFADPVHQVAHAALSPSAEGMSQVLSASAALIPIIFKTPNEQSLHTSEPNARYSQTSMSTVDSPQGHPRNPYGLNGVLEAENSDRVGSERRTSGASAKPVGPLAALFQRTRAGSRSTVPESSFSNTSRESMSRQPIPLHLRDSPQPPRPLSSQAPSRAGTRSKFREDLPESPVAAPDLRLHSPIDSRAYLPELPESATFSPRQLEKLPETVGTLPRDIPLPQAPKDPYGFVPPLSGMVMSHSLASVDSEASWLSGKPSKRLSVSESMPQASLRDRSDTFNGSYENLGVTDEEYFEKLNHSRHPSQSNAKKIRAVLADSDDEGVGPHEEGSRTTSGAHVLHGEIARAPTVVHRQVRVQSNQGIFTEFGSDMPSSPVVDDEMDDYASSASSPNRIESSPATDRTSATNFGATFGIQHARQGSRGSARLLNIPARKDSIRSSLVLLDTPGHLASNRSSGVMLDAMGFEGSDRSSTVDSRAGYNVGRRSHDF